MAVTLKEIKTMLKEMFKEFKKETEEMFRKQEKIGANIKIINDRLDKAEVNINVNVNKIKELSKELEDIKIDGIDENGQESWGDSEAKVHAFFWQNLGLKNIEIERAHRTGLKKDGRPRTIVLNLQKYKDKIRILKESHRLKGTNCFINEDFSRETVVFRKKLFAEVKQRRLNGENVSVRYDKIVYLNKNFENNLNK
ncbi:uncharacterized protein LOC136089808 [Hydra vulgaris]|uniref:Uncharacterized protein LOC136089808 n=1 Tax=Hydra vulgaris TaxID=6087 RepID=A0ABM4DC57_HYDVU